VAVVAECQVLEAQRRGHRVTHEIAHNTAAQIAAIATLAAASRSTAESRRIDGETAAGGWASPGWWW
jgi:hypothetical protein